VKKEKKDSGEYEININKHERRRYELIGRFHLQIIKKNRQKTKEVSFLIR
jgi:hypothetical protein